MAVIYMYYYIFNGNDIQYINIFAFNDCIKSKSIIRNGKFEQNVHNLFLRPVKQKRL